MRHEGDVGVRPAPQPEILGDVFLERHEGEHVGSRSREHVIAAEHNLHVEEA